MKIDNMKHPKLIKALVAENAGSEILIDLDLLVEWTILPKDFPLPMDPNEREDKVRKVTVTDAIKSAAVEVKEKVGSKRSQMKFNEMDEQEYDSSNQMEALKKRLMKEYKDIFKTELSTEDRIDIEPVVIDTVDNFKSFKPVNHMTAIECPLHLQSAAKKDLKKMMDAGFLEKCKKPTSYCSRAFFVAKPGSGSGSDLKVRMVSDFRQVNRVLKRPGIPWRGVPPS